MTLSDPEEAGLPFLSKDDFPLDKKGVVSKKTLKATIVSKPEYRSSKFGDKLNVDIETKEGDFRWSMNNTSASYLLKKFSKDEKKWLTKTIEILRIVDGTTDGLYAKGAKQIPTKK